MPRQKKYNTESERKKAKRLATARYRKTKKGKKNIAKYLKSIATDKKKLIKNNRSLLIIL